MAMFMYSLVVVWFHRTGHQFMRFPFRPWYPKKAEPSFADMLTTLRRLSLRGENRGIACEPVIAENLACPAHRAPQSHRVIVQFRRGFPRPHTTSRSIKREDFHFAGTFAVRLQKSAKLERGTWRRTTLHRFRLHHGGYRPQNKFVTSPRLCPV